jgi:hypothetical protein
LIDNLRRRLDLATPRNPIIENSGGISVLDDAKRERCRSQNSARWTMKKEQGFVSPAPKLCRPCFPVSLIVLN